MGSQRVRHDWVTERSFVAFFFRFHLSGMSYNISSSLSEFTQYDHVQVHPCCCKHHYLFFDGWVIFHCICIYTHTPHLLNPFLCWWTFKLLPCLGYCKKCCNDHWGACILLDHVFLWIHVWEVYLDVKSKEGIRIKLVLSVWFEQATFEKENVKGVRNGN